MEIYKRDWRASIITYDSENNNVTNLTFDANYNVRGALMIENTFSIETNDYLNTNLEIGYSDWNGPGRPNILLGNIPHILTPSTLKKVAANEPILRKNVLWIGSGYQSKNITKIELLFIGPELQFTLEAQGELYDVATNVVEPYSIIIEEKQPCQITVVVTDAPTIFLTKDKAFVEKEMHEYFETFHDKSCYSLTPVTWTNDDKDATLVASRT